MAAAASAWLNAPQDVRAYTRLVAAVEAWDAYESPALIAAAAGAGEEELLDQIADRNPPAPLGAGIAELADSLRAVHRREL